MELLLILYIILLICFSFVRFLSCNIHKIVYQIILSTYDYIRYKRYNECNAFGKIRVFTGLFGQGKTKECVRKVVGLYNHYHGKKIWSDVTKSWIRQNVVIYSNVKLTIPYIPFESMQQMVNCQKEYTEGTINLFLIDEASVVFNSRDFKKNFSTPALNTILTCRHHKIGIFLTAQRFSHLDALLRQVVSDVYDCTYNPFLHIQRIRLYNGYELEYCSNVALVKPVSVSYSWTSKKVYGMYDTYAMVGDVVKNVIDGNYVTDFEALLAQQNTPDNPQMVGKLSRKGKKRFGT